MSKEWASRADLPHHVVQLVNSFPSSLHPMSQFSSAITAMQSDSHFAKAYSEGIHKSKYWEVRITLSLSLSLCLSFPLLLTKLLCYSCVVVHSILYVRDY